MIRFARGSAPWLAAPLVVALALGGAAFVPGLAWLAWLAIVPVVVFGLLAAFFRDPERSVAEGICSPADGKVVFIDTVEDPDVCPGPVERYSIFMHPKDVHVNRTPLAAKVVSVTHIPGKHIPAFNKESERNERVATLFELEDGTRVKVIQIAGAVARRIVPYLTAGQVVAKGQRMGLIRLGSRCDILLPPGRATWTVQPGTQVHGASTSLGTFRPKEAAAATQAEALPAAEQTVPRAARAAMAAMASSPTAASPAARAPRKGATKPAKAPKAKRGGT